MDVGCYTINMVRFLAGTEPRVTDARALLASPQVDRRMEADFEFDGRCTGRMVCSLFSRTLLRVHLEARGTEGSMRVFNPILPQLYHRVTVRTAAGRSVERVPGDGTYTCQLRAFVRTVRGGPACPTDARSGVANMRVIDAVYEKAGLRLRGQ
jgi:predicted dehydrogenase